MFPYITIKCKGCNSHQRSTENVEAYVVSKFILISKIPTIAPLTGPDQLGHDAVFMQACINNTHFYINNKIVLFNAEKAI